MKAPTSTVTMNRHNRTTSEVTNEIRSWRLLITKLHDLRVISGTHWELHATEGDLTYELSIGTKSFLWKWRSCTRRIPPFENISAGSDGRCQIIRLVLPDRRTCEDKERTRVLGDHLNEYKNRRKNSQMSSKSQTSHFHTWEQNHFHKIRRQESGRPLRRMNGQKRFSLQRFRIPSQDRARVCLSKGARDDWHRDLERTVPYGGTQSKSRKSNKGSHGLLPESTAHDPVSWHSEEVSRIVAHRVGKEERKSGTDFLVKELFVASVVVHDCLRQLEVVRKS